MYVLQVLHLVFEAIKCKTRTFYRNQNDCDEYICTTLICVHYVLLLYVHLLNE